MVSPGGHDQLRDERQTASRWTSVASTTSSGGPPAHRALVDRLWRDAIQGINGSFDLDIDPGAAGQHFIGECTQLCGTHHRFVRSWVQVVPKDKFNTWLKDHHGPSAATAEGSS